MTSSTAQILHTNLFFDIDHKLFESEVMTSSLLYKFWIIPKSVLLYKFWTYLMIGLKKLKIGHSRCPINL